MHQNSKELPIKGKVMEAEEEKTKEEPKLDTGKTTGNGGYTIPVQMS